MIRTPIITETAARSLTFRLDDNFCFYAEIRDRETGELVKEIPIDIINKFVDRITMENAMLTKRNKELELKLSGYDYFKRSIKLDSLNTGLFD